MEVMAMEYPKPVKFMNEKLAVASGFIILLIGFFSVFEVLTRFLYKPSIWTADVSQYLLIWAIFLAAGYGFQAKGHIRVDALTRRLPFKARQGLSITAYSASFIFVVILAKGACALWYTSYSLNMMTYALFQIPRTILVTAIIIGCVLMFITIIAIIIDLIGKNETYHS